MSTSLHLSANTPCQRSRQAGTCCGCCRREQKTTTSSRRSARPSPPCSAEARRCAPTRALLRLSPLRRRRPVTMQAEFIRDFSGARRQQPTGFNVAKHDSPKHRDETPLPESAKTESRLQSRLREHPGGPADAGECTGLVGGKEDSDGARQRDECEPLSCIRGEQNSADAPSRRRTRPRDVSTPSKPRQRPLRSSVSHRV